MWPSSIYILYVGLFTGVVSTQACDILTTVNGLSKTLVSGYTYDASITPEITNVNPARGGTGGGTQITITGTGFGYVLILIKHCTYVFKTPICILEHPYVLEHIYVFWNTYMYFGTPICILEHLYVFWNKRGLTWK